MSFAFRRNRREFLQQTLAATAAFAFAPACQRFTRSSQTQLDPDALKRFGTTLKGSIVLPTDPTFDKARRIFFWSPKTERQPSLIARCAHPDDVMRCIEFARRHSLEIAVRSGGHSPAGWGTTNGLLIDLRGLKQINIEPTRRLARLEAGVLSGDVVSEAQRYNLAPILGQCPGVGAAGLLTGGGLGWLSGLHGAACDNLHSARLITADSQTLSVDAAANPDLFWALRGGGGNFGVMTSFECQLVPIGLVTAGEVHFHLRDARTVMRVFRDLMAEAPDAFQATLNLTPGEHSAWVHLCHAGDPAEAQRLLHALRSVAPVTRDTVKRQPFAESAGLPPMFDPTPPGWRYVHGLYRERISDDFIDLTLARLEGAPAEAVIGLSHYMHGQVCRVKPEETAFPLRTTGSVHVRISATWTDPAAADGLVTWTDATWRQLRVTSGERLYSNYQSYEGKGASEASFGGNHARLVAIKGRYDPDNIFRRNTNVQPGDQSRRRS